MILPAMNGWWLAKALSALAGCLLLIATPRCEAQNLVPNPSFEVLDTCPYTIGFQEGDRPLNWYSWFNSPDYFHSCAQPVNGTDTLVGVPRNGWAFQYPFDGDAYTGVYTYGNGAVYREHIGVQLLSPLIIGQTYYASFRANMAADGTYWPARWASNRLGMLFAMQPNIWTGLTGPPFSFRNFAHVYSQQVITDTVGWTLVSGSFVADSAYQYLVIGNFFEDWLTDTVMVSPGISAGAYYLIDAVCVSASGEGCAMTTVNEHDTGGDLLLGPNPASHALFVKWPGRQAFTVEVLDALGRTVIKSSMHATGSSLSIDELSQGTYLLRAVDHGDVIVRRFVVQR